jgi:hypothetical protein
MRGAGLSVMNERAVDRQWGRWGSDAIEDNDLVRWVIF